jgi:GT2 family glycosyltransferase
VLTPLLEDPVVDRVIVVNDAKDDGAPLRLSDAEIPSRVEVYPTGGVGPAGARQAGAERASADLLLFVDDDVVPDPELASKHVAHHEKRPKLLVCGYTPVVPTNGGELSPEARVYGNSYEKRCRQYELDRGDVLTHLWGGNFSLPREDAIAVGLSSSEFRESWHEDRDFGLRCREAGLAAVFDRGIRAGHQYERSWPEVRREAYYRGYSLAVLHEVHKDVIGSFDPHYFERKRILPLRWIVRAFSRNGGSDLAVRGLHLTRRVGDRLNLRVLQLLSVRTLRLLQSAAGARDAVESRPKRVQPPG